MTPLRIGIIGTGFAGTSLAVTLAHQTAVPLEIILFEKTGHFGPGIAYSTLSPFHLLNVCASDMSALASQPDHFVQWMQQHETRYAGRWQIADGLFVSRWLYGEYLRDLIETLRADKRITLTCVPDNVTNLRQTQAGLEILSSSSATLVDKVILSIGNSLPPAPAFPVSDPVRYRGNPWDPAAFQEILPSDTVVLVGTGLTMIDSVLSLIHQQHQGRIVAISRHGHLPLSHAPLVIPYVSQLSLRGSLAEMVRLLREEGERHGDWRALVTAFREHIPTVWQGFSERDKRAFLRHLQTLWNIHRHRAPAGVLAKLRVLERTAQLQVMRGRVISYEERTIKVRLRAHDQASVMPADWVINCMGPAGHLRGNRLIQSLVNQGVAVWDPCQLGIQVTAEGALYNAAGKVSQDVYALGSPCRGAIWECTAVPEIRRLAAGLAGRLLAE